MEIEFVKMEGIGNDFVLLDDRDGSIQAHTPYPQLAKKLCSRRFGIGADGILLMLNSAQSDMTFHIYNSDGSQAQMCGNGIRCLAKYMYENKLVSRKQIRVETLAGLMIPEVIIDETDQVVSVRVDMGKPVLKCRDIPFKSEQDTSVEHILRVKGTEYTITAVSMGNPHAVIFVEDLSSVNLEQVGPEIETHERFPEKTNVEFVQVISDTELKMRVWERGAGMTLACGTGACAVLVAACLTGRVKDHALIHLDGGDLELFWDKTTGHVFKTGPARQVFSGTIHI
ncbi:MAG: diaminopimelate epimerase [Proteobacteria bacterium]|nr:diaminopimelate epimerase [Pseudomonadota bacterium]MBU1389069.1 diaminopimelate epimerase [Pseudomonadota bacterium]MBU1543622.1 diaminopimelate epimerase [Pseudomonadota bacterium]MBU2479826.1 diaminopimelate epimerase [Pseudomonadota bacterium]